MNDGIVSIELDEEGSSPAGHGAPPAKWFYIKYNIDMDPPFFKEADRPERQGWHRALMNLIEGMTLTPAWGGIFPGWIIQSRLSAAQIRDELKQYIRWHCDLLVIEIADLADFGFDQTTEDVTRYCKDLEITDFPLAPFVPAHNDVTAAQLEAITGKKLVNDPRITSGH
jgi:hypothetical protein